MRASPSVAGWFYWESRGSDRADGKFAGDRRGKSSVLIADVEAGRVCRPEGDWQVVRLSVMPRRSQRGRAKPRTWHS
jgi:hypothetical protein